MLRGRKVSLIAALTLRTAGSFSCGRLDVLVQRPDYLVLDLRSVLLVVYLCVCV